MIRKALAGALATAAVAAPIALAAPAQASGGTTILDVVSSVDRYTETENKGGLDRFRWDQRNWYDFDILTAAVVADGSLVDEVTSAATAVTLFAPNDRAFQLLAYDLSGKWLFTEQAVLDAIVGQVTAGKVDLTNVLTYHVVEGRFMKADVVPLIGKPITTLNGGSIIVQPPNAFGQIAIKDEVDALRNPSLVRTDIDAGNSVVHSISRVLVPANFAG
jgi:uncharacterized surface protein with fasciclin (FAS1) repeats